MSPTAQLGDIHLWEHPGGEQKLRELLEADIAFLLAHNSFLTGLTHLQFLECALVSCAPVPPYTLPPAWASFPPPSLLIHLVLPCFKFYLSGKLVLSLHLPLAERSNIPCSR